MRPTDGRGPRSADKPRFVIDVPWGLAWFWYFQGTEHLAAICGFQFSPAADSWRLMAAYYVAFLVMALAIWWGDIREWKRKHARD